MACFRLILVLLAAAAARTASQSLFEEVEVSAAAAGQKVKIPRVLRRVKSQASAAAAAGGSDTGFPIKIVSVNKPLLLSKPAELLLLLPGQTQPLKAIHRPEVPASPSSWVGELEISPAPASGVVLTVSTDTGAVYGDIRYIDPVSGETRSFWLAPVVWESSNGASAASAKDPANPTTDPRLSAVIEHGGTPDKKNVPVTPPVHKKRKANTPKTVRKHKKNSSTGAADVTAAAYADKLNRFKQQKRQQRAAAGLTSSSLTGMAYSTVRNARFAAGTVVAPTAGLSKPGEEVEAAAAETQQTLTTIDVMIVATPDAINSANGHDALRAMARTAIDNANTAYVNSGMNVKLRLVGADQSPDASVKQVQYSESGRSYSTILSNLRDGSIPNVRQWREETGADVVVLYNTNNQVCGVGYFSQSNDGRDFDDWAYSAVMDGCWDGFTTTHEIGHNQGCGHDHDVDWSSRETYPEYAHGYKACNLGQGKAFNTIMSYGDCGSFRSKRVALISNVAKTWNGALAGDKKTANCALRITTTAPAVSTYRTAPGGGGTGPCTGTNCPCASGTYKCNGVCVPTTECCPSAKKTTDPGACGWDQVCDASTKVCKSRCGSGKYACGTEKNHATDFCIPDGTCCTRLPDSCIQPFDCPADGGVCTCPRGVNCGSDCPAGQKQCKELCIDNDSCCSEPDDCGDDQFCEADGGQCTSLCDQGERLCDGEICIKEENCCLADMDPADCQDPFYCPDDDEPCACSFDDPSACCEDGLKSCSGECISQDSCCTSEDCNFDQYCPYSSGTCTSKCEDGWTFCGEWCYKGDVCCLSNPGGDDCGTALTGEKLTCPEDGSTCSCPSGLKSCPAQDGSGTRCIPADNCCPSLDDCSDPYVCIDGSCSCPLGQKDCYNEEDDEWKCIDESSCCVYDQDCPQGLTCQADGDQCKCANGQSTCLVNGAAVCYSRLSNSKTCCTDSDCTAQANSACRRSGGALLGACAKCAKGLKPCNGKCIRNSFKCTVKKG